MTAQRHYRNRLAPLLLSLLVVVLVSALVVPATGRAAQSGVPVGYVPATATSAQIAAATPAQPLLVGISKEYPPTCDGITDTKVEDTKATTNTDRVDVGAPAIELAGLTPGTTYSYCFFVQNVGNAAIAFRINATELVGVDDPDTKQQLIRPPQSVGTWLHPVATQFKLEPGERQYVPYTIDVPTNPPAGTTTGALEVLRLDGENGSAGAGFFISMLHKVLITFPGGRNEKLDVTHVRAPSILTRQNGRKTYVLRLNAHNPGNMVDVHHTTLTMRGLGRTVAKTRSSDSVLLPDGTERIEVRIKNMPWIGIYHPHATLTGRAGTVDINLPWLVVLPPWPFLVALILAVLLPIVVVARHWLRSRTEWREYLDAEDSEDWIDEDAAHD